MGWKLSCGKRSDKTGVSVRLMMVFIQDLDYKYSRMGELSPYFHSLAFSPSYFHRVIRTGVNAAMYPDGNPIVYLDISPWGKELATNLQLLQDRVTTTT